jgi:hypothetical protein
MVFLETETLLTLMAAVVEVLVVLALLEETLEMEMAE